MNQGIKRLFLMLVLAQGFHSIEEYVGRLWEVFEPARLLTGMISNDLETGFLIINIGLFVFGMACWAGPVRMNTRVAKPLLVFWSGLECFNGIGHTVWTVSSGSYTVGMLTAPLLLVLGIILAVKLAKWHDAPQIRTM